MINEVPESPKNLDQNETLQFHLIRAEHHLQKAMDTVYTTRGPIRGLLYRLRLGRAQNTAMVLYKKEIERK